MSDYPAPTGRAVRAGHYIEAAVVSFAFAQLALICAAVLLEFSALLYIGLITIAAYAVAAVTWWPKHGRGLCEVCFAAFPLNAPEEATRIRRWLRATHIVDDGARWLLRTLRVPNTVAAQMAAAVAIGAAVAFLLMLVAPWLAIAVMAAVIVVLRGALLHQRFTPWCPWCRNGRGDDEQAPVPEPDPVASQTL